MSSHIIKRKAYLMGLPCPGRYVKSILLKATPNPKEVIVTFVTSEIQLTCMLIDNAQLWSKNIDQLSSALMQSLRVVPQLRGTAQMRVTLGSFIFEQYRRPKDHENGYSFDEFGDMLSQEMTRGHITSTLEPDQIIDHINRASHLFVLENGQGPVSTACRSVKVEFASRTGTSLHLEVEFQAHGGQYEKVRTCWVETEFDRARPEKRPVLQAVMLNPERADWELKIREKTILNPGQLSPSMRDVQASLQFNHDTPGNALVTPAKQHCMLPSNAQIYRLIEKSTMQYPIKETDYVLEIARYDIYYPKVCPIRHNADASSYMEFKTPTSFTEAVLYGRTWDTRLKNINQARDLNSVLAALFQPRQRETPRAAFERFIMITTNVAGLWNPAGLQPMVSIPRPSSQSYTSMAQPRHVPEGILIDLD
ncbi:conserved hypothetical protein [Talaromyces stipitatus ATCC 10500]|uniref:DUF7905 domain-containing protein n=1 Tax=Talaromyces stipitatus (strain ATCC 10500 / CBS 375.48 / QM 6759 / NRRL 1006) TaxID=441959 RepID=B8LW88_TALSN|nr:uncharacterized protein TSTA_074940 [Talaromyces stipitatus ATCC 10500]EED24116.1 conserved hypothetical protein [Talaromyces stipitatus ATCC 10500]